MIFSMTKLIKEGQEWRPFEESLSWSKQKIMVAWSRMLAVETERSRQIFNKFGSETGLANEKYLGGEKRK